MLPAGWDPLAIELAAARVTLLSVEQIARRLRSPPRRRRAMLAREQAIALALAPAEPTTSPPTTE